MCRCLGRTLNTQFSNSASHQRCDHLPSRKSQQDYSSPFYLPPPPSSSAGLLHRRASPTSRAKPVHTNRQASVQSTVAFIYDTGANRCLVVFFVSATGKNAVFTMTETVVNVQEAPNNNAPPNKGPGGTDQPLGWIKINLDYFKSTPGLLKIAEFVLGILCMSLGSPAYYGGSHFFLFVVVVSFIGTLIWIAIYLLGIREAINFPINWLLTEYVNTAICTVCYVIAFILQLIVSASLHYGHYRRGAQIAAGVFGIINALVYGFATYLLHLEWKGSRTN